ncbi:MAG: DUF1549 and DUF1553 domain-containing protein [Verrucomicrobiales bacterium]
MRRPITRRSRHSERFLTFCGLAFVIGRGAVLLEAQGSEALGAAFVAAAGKKIDYQGGREFWSFRPLRHSFLPAVSDRTWLRTAVDAFVLAKLESEGLIPNGDADPRTLLRRVTYDLTGLPPTSDDIASYLADRSNDAFEKVVERLLSSPAYGERWGQHWLDLARYADTSGCNADVPIPDAWKYRNWVIDALNHDKPYDDFIREQIAGDLLPAASDAEGYQKIIATGYLAISRRFSSVAEEPHLTLDDTIDNVGKALLGLTVSCGRCHDHKYDPISTQDYYALYGIFESTRYSFPGTEIPRHRRHLVALVPRDRYEAEIKPHEEKLATVDTEMDAHYARKTQLDTGQEKDAADAAWKKCNDQHDALIKSGPVYDTAYAVAEGHSRHARIQIKGDPKKPGDEVPRAFLTVLGGQKVPVDQKGSGRRLLADWLADHPLTARVMVNRIWLHHFGQGIVRTPNDFGTRGEPPTHPELLDFLAARFIESGWSVKALHRVIVLSRAYGMSSVDQSAALAKDPANRWLWRFERRRLSAEEIRDSWLALSGDLDFSPAGPHPFKPELEWRYTQHNPFVDDFPSSRRSIYLLHQRIRTHLMLGVYDGADPNMATGQRPLSTTAVQGLFMMNNKFVHKQAERFAVRLLGSARGFDERLNGAFESTLSRSPSPEERFEAEDYLDATAARFSEAGRQEKSEQERAAWASYLRVLFGSNEFIYVE